MNPILIFLRSPQGKALTQHAIEAAGQHLIDVMTQKLVPEQAPPANPQPRARLRYARDAHIKEADVLDVRVDETYKYDPATDPDAP